MTMTAAGHTPLAAAAAIEAKRCWRKKNPTPAETTGIIRLPILGASNNANVWKI